MLRQSALPGQLRGIAGLNSSMVGREDEIKTLIDGIEAVRYGRAQIFSIMGEAGLGKSRLVAEVRHALATGIALATNGAKPGGANDPDQRAVGWYEGRSLSFESSTAYARLQACSAPASTYGRSKQTRSSMSRSALRSERSFRTV